jgi:RHS repeat-associated protein
LYSCLGLLVSSNASGVSVGYAYDSQNRLTTVTDNRLPAGQNTTTYTYDDSSYVVTATYPNGLQSAFNWDSRHRLTNLANPVASYSYGLDNVGNPTSSTEGNGRTPAWNYDGIYRLTQETVSQDPAGKNGSVAYTLDPVSNRLSAASTLPGVASSTATYNADDLLSTETYDLNGNVIAAGGKSFTYDSDNRLTAMNGNAVQLLYDGWGNRVAKTVAGVTTRYLVDDLNPTGYPQVVEELVGGAVTRQYTYGFQRISENQLLDNQNGNAAWTPSSYGYDGLGSVRQLTNLAGAVTDTYTYDAFGNLLAQPGTTPNDFRYRGEQYDATLGLQYLRARYYNPATGRFLSKDPSSGNVADPKSLHRYSYAGVNPSPAATPAAGPTTRKRRRSSTPSSTERRRP